MGMELLGSELEYLNHLTEIRESFEQPLMRAALPASLKPQALFAPLPGLALLHRSMVATLEGFSQRASTSFSTSAEDLRASASVPSSSRRLAAVLLEYVEELEKSYVDYATNWATTAAHTLSLLEADAASASIVGTAPKAALSGHAESVDDLSATGEAGGEAADDDDDDPSGPAKLSSKLRRLLELPLSRVTVYENAAVELQMAIQPADPSWASVTRLLESLAGLTQRLAEQRTELERVTKLRSVVAKFRPGDADELVDPSAPRRSLVHGGKLVKSSKMGKLARYYFLFDDGALLTAEQGKGSSRMLLGGSRDSRAERQLKLCKWLSLTGASLHVPIGKADATYLEINYPEHADKTNRIWTDSPAARDLWLTKLLQVLHTVHFPQPPPLLPARPRCVATDPAARAQMRARVACYRRQASLLRGGWHAAVVGGGAGGADGGGGASNSAGAGDGSPGSADGPVEAPGTVDCPGVGRAACARTAGQSRAALRSIPLTAARARVRV